MIVDGRGIPYHTTLRADVVVIGAGPGGITVAEEMARHGRHVLLIEAAGRTHGRGDDDALGGEGTGDPFPLVRSRHRGFGGTSTHWTPATGLRVRPLDEIDFVARPGRSDVSWPFGISVLKPYYERAYQSIGLDSANEAGRWYGSENPTPLAWPGGPQLAMFQFAPHDVFTRRFDAVAGSTAIELVLHSTASRLEMNGATDEVQRVVLRTLDGGEFFAEADAYVVACGAIENARLLLASTTIDGRSLGNQHDNVGRYFMDHLSVDTGILEPGRQVELAAAVFRERRLAGGDPYQPMLWLGDEWITREGLPNAAFWIEEVDRYYLSAGVGATRSLRGALHASPRRHVARRTWRALVGSPAVAAFAARRALPLGKFRVLSMRILTEQLPNRDSRVRLSTRRDRLGLARACVDWRMTAADLDVVTAHQALLGRLLAEHGVATLTSPFRGREHPSPIMTNYHHLGGTRMHVDPRHGVVDADGRIHSVTNAYVIGGSVFPAGGYVNPTLTIIALAFRTAAVIARRWTPATVRSANA